MNNKLTCVICDSEDFDLLSLKLPINGEMKPVGIVYCCQGCKDKLQAEIREYGRLIGLALNALDRESGIYE